MIIADRQEITRYALQRLIEEMGTAQEVTIALSSAAIREALHARGVDASETVVIDYTAIDITEEELLLLHLRFPKAHFLLFSDQLSRDLLRRLVLNNRQFSVVLKEAPIHEIREALIMAIKNRHFISSDAQNIIAMPEMLAAPSPLSKTERDILRLMALGKNSRAIAEERFLSVHTVMTHRKNIFRKLNVNNDQEAIRYALRAGIVDPLEYYI